MVVIPVFVSATTPDFGDERAVLDGPVRDALNALVEPYGCEVEFVDSPQDGAIFVGLVSGEFPSVPEGFDTPIFLVRELGGEIPAGWRNAETGFTAPPGAVVYEYAAIADGTRIPDLSEFADLTVDASSCIVVGRARTTGRRVGVPDGPGTALELAIVLQKIGDAAREQDDPAAATSAYDESLAILHELHPDPRVQAEIEFLEILLDYVEEAERMKRSRGSRGHTTYQLPSLNAPNHRAAKSRWWSFKAPPPQPADIAELGERRAAGHLSVVGPATSTVDTDDIVDCSVFAPPTMSCDSIALVQVFVHVPEDAAVVAREATAFDDGATRRGVHTLGVPVNRDDRLDFQLSIRGVEVPDDVQSLQWRGRPTSVQFEAIVPETSRVGISTVGTVHVIRDGVTVGSVKFKIEIVSPRAQAAPELAGDVATRYRRVFISYARQDKAAVLGRVQVLRSMQIEYFQDIDIDPGERWERELYKKIDGCDLLLLFWSTSAKESEWVRREVQYALQLGDRAPDIRPVVIEGPPPPSPWEELADLHFDDRLLGLLAAAG